ncbi:short-chain dehydrogenase [Fimbriimonas ginsengisoli Gsoil 348]|uniref:Short-chain dehydrogenase n=1 Tax=Fimbriimonas ginsengisoli Gsoil 348 TaxID=661478 RepID=A0A068NRX1_FIMGI|nr:short-chain dehydrogenase [Fimbriimonas ginsengisoli Gsoil 348]
MVTGAGSGIGRASAIALGEAGFAVALMGRREDRLAPVAEVIGERVTVVVADVADERQVARGFERVFERFGRLDLLFNNAGTSSPAVPIDELSLSQWQAVVDTNLTGSFLCAREAFRLMKTQSPMGGRIINNGSISAHVPRLYSVPYTATKHAITGLTKALSLEGRAFDIACGQIDIGNAESEMTERTKLGMLQPNGELATEPVIDVAHIAKAVVYMASLPLDANVQFMTVMATKMPYIGRG